MKLDYGSIISPYPIELSIGAIRKPTLAEIADPQKIGFQQFGLYQSLLVLTPQEYYKNLNDEHSYYFSFSDDEKQQLTMFDAIARDANLRNLYVSLFNLFFVEQVIYAENVFVLLNQNTQINNNTNDSIRGVIAKDNFNDVINVIKQICGMQADEDVFSHDLPKKKFKTKKAKRLYEKIMMANTTKKHAGSINLSLPNIISAVCGCHPSINYTNVYHLTVYQLFDTFERMKTNSMFELFRTKVSVWGNEKNWFDSELWYKNNYDNKNSSA